MSHRDSTSTKEQLLNLKEALNSGAFVQVRRILNHSLPAVEVAHLLESSPPKVRNILWSLIDKESGGEILPHLSDEISVDFLSKMDPQEVLDVTAGLDTDDIADLLQQLPDQLIQEVLRSMDSQNRHRLEQVLSYSEDTAGGLMNIDTITVRPDISVDVVLRYLRLHPKIPDMTDNLPVVNRNDQVVGILPINKILVSDPSSSVREIMSTDVFTILADTPEMEVAQLFERHDLISAPVVDDNQKLLGRITIDDVVDVIREEAEHSFMSMAGLDEDEDTFAPVLKSTKRRSVWLFVNLITAFLASYVIGLFEATIEKVVALAILMPIVASMGGVAGSQTLTLMIRGIALGHVQSANANWLLQREIIVGFINGVIWALVVALVATWWFNDTTIGIIIALAVIINLVAAAIAGASLPMILKRMGIDPAIAGSVLLTTITDVIGFMAFLGLATFFYA